MQRVAIALLFPLSTANVLTHCAVFNTKPRVYQTLELRNSPPQPSPYQPIPAQPNPVIQFFNRTCLHGWPASRVTGTRYNIPKKAGRECHSFQSQLGLARLGPIGSISRTCHTQ